MALKQITAATNPVTLAEVKAHLRVTHALEDALIGIYLAAAMAHVDGPDGYLGRAVASQTWELSYDAFPDSPIEIPLPPLQSVEWIKYYDTDGNLQTLAGAEYVVDTESVPGWVAPVTTWPATFETANAVVIRFTAGYASAPATIKAGILLLAGDLYANREANVEKALAENPSINRLLFPLRILSV